MEEGVEVEKSPSTTPFPSFTLKAGTGGKGGHGWLGSCQLAPTPSFRQVDGSGAVGCGAQGFLFLSLSPQQSVPVLA